jgi:hypothetical protein
MAEKMNDEPKRAEAEDTTVPKPTPLSETGEEIPLPPFRPDEDLITYIERARRTETKK